MDQRKLLLNERVEVRQFEEGLQGSWHPGVVVGVSELCRYVEYDELLSETSDSKLIESIPVTRAIEGHYHRRHLSSTCRGRIRPPPPTRDNCKKLGFGVCVDAFFKDAWWEGVIFDCNDKAKERLVFFPDEGDQRKFCVSSLRITRDWDEILGIWCDRGVWILVQLAKELHGDVASSNYLRKVWTCLELNYGFNKMISEWMWGDPVLWNKYFMDANNKISVGSSQQHFLNGRIRASVRAKKRNNTKDSKRDQITLLTVTTRQTRSSGMLKPTRSSEKGEESPLVECKQRRSLKSKLKSENQRVINTVTGTIHEGNQTVINTITGTVHEGNNICKENQMTDVNFFEKSDQVFRISSSLNETVNPASLPTQKKQSGKVKLNADKRKLCKVCEGDVNKHLVGCSKLENVSAHDASHVQKGQLVRETRSSTKHKKIAINVNLSNFSRELRKRNPSAAIVSKQRKCSLIRKRVSKGCQPVNSNFKPPSKVKEKGLDAKKIKDVLSLNHCHATLPIENCGKNVSVKDMVSCNRKNRRNRRYHHIQLVDTVCSACHYGDGDLILCDNCPSSYHMSCLDLKDVPHRKWFCPSCRCGSCGQRGDNEQFTNACLQCSREYHLYCPSNAGCQRPMKYLLEKFCSQACYKLCAQLHHFLGVCNPTSVNGVTWTLTRSSRNAYGFSCKRADTSIKLSRVLKVMHECFQPVKDPHSKRDLVRDVVYSSVSKLKRLNFCGFYNMVLHKGDEIISVATFRIHGLKAAEMPLVSTDFEYRRQGMCRLLMHELLKLLSQMGVKRLILPSIPQLRKTWESSFGFSEMPHSERLELLGYPFLGFQGTTMLQKFLSSSTTMKETDVSLKTCRDSSIASLEHDSGPNTMGNRFFGLYYERKVKPKFLGKENMVNSCNQEMQSGYHVYKRRRLLVCKD